MGTEPTAAVMDAKSAAIIAKNADATPKVLLTALGASVETDRKLARHPNASLDLLEALSHSKDRSTRKLVALHPNAPKAVLIALASQFPGEFFKNPAFDWLLVEATRDQTVAGGRDSMKHGMKDGPSLSRTLRPRGPGPERETGMWVVNREGWSRCP